MQGLGPGSGAPDAAQQPRPRGGRAPRGSRRLRRDGQGGPELGMLRRDRPRASRARAATRRCWCSQARRSGGFRTHPDAPRVLLANSNLVPHWATWDEFRRLEAAGLTMFGQMTAGSWIYIGTQGILQGTYETFVAARRAYVQRTGKSGPLWVLTAGLGGMGGAQPLAATMAGLSCLAVEVDGARIEKRLATRYVDERVDDLDAALARLEAAGREGRPVSLGLCGNAAEVFPELVRRKVVPDLVTEQTAAHDPLNGYVPLGLTLAEAAELRAEDPAGYVERAKASMAEEVVAMLWLKAPRGGGVRLRQQPPRVRARRRVRARLRHPGLRARVHPAALLRREGAVPLGRAQRRSGGHRGDRRGRARRRAARRRSAPVDRAGAGARELPGAAGAHLLARLRRSRPGRAGAATSSFEPGASRRPSSSAATTSTAAASRRPTARPRR